MPPVKAKLVDKGWLFELDGKTAGPFLEEEMEGFSFEEKVASQLGVERREVYVVSLQIPERLRIPVESQNPSTTGRFPWNHSFRVTRLCDKWCTPEGH